MPKDTRSYTLLCQFFTDLGTVPALSSSEEEALLTRLRLAAQAQLASEQARLAKQRLVEGYVRRVVTLARVAQVSEHNAQAFVAACSPPAEMLVAAS